MKKVFAILLSTLLFSLTARSEMELKTNQQYQISHSPESFCTNGVFCFYTYGNKVANYVNIELLKVNGAIQDLEIFPTGTSFYALYSGKDQVSENVGSEQRRVSVSFTFPDTFE